MAANTKCKLINKLFTDSVKSAAKLSKKSTATKRKKVLQTIPLDITGRPKFPIKLGDLTVHSLGEVCYGLVLNILLSVMFADKKLIFVYWVFIDQKRQPLVLLWAASLYANYEWDVFNEVSLVIFLDQQFKGSLNVSQRLIWWVRVFIETKFFWTYLV